MSISFNEFVRRQLPAELRPWVASDPQEPTQLSAAPAQRPLRRGLIEQMPGLISLITALSFILSIIYNFGYFSTVNFDAIWLLTPGDYVTSAIPAIAHIIIFCVTAAPVLWLLLWIMARVLRFLGVVSNNALRAAGRISPRRPRRKETITGSDAEIKRRAGWVQVIQKIGAFILVAAVTLWYLWVFYDLSVDFLSRAASAPVYVVPLFIALLNLALAAYLTDLSLRPHAIRTYLGVAIVVLPVCAVSYFVYGMSSGYLSRMQFRGNASHEECAISAHDATVDRYCLIRIIERGSFYWDVAGSADAAVEPADRLIFIPNMEEGVLTFSVQPSAPTYWIDVIFRLMPQLREWEPLSKTVYAEARKHDERQQKKDLKRAFDWKIGRERDNEYRSSELASARSEIVKANDKAIELASVSGGDTVVGIFMDDDALSKISQLVSVDGLVIDINYRPRAERRMWYRRKGLKNVVATLGDLQSLRVPESSIDTAFWDTILFDQIDKNQLKWIGDRLKKGEELYLIGIRPEFIDLPELADQMNVNWESDLRAPSEAAGFSSVELMDVGELEKTYIYRLVR